MISFIHLFLAAAFFWLSGVADFGSESKIVPKVLIITFFHDEGQIYLANSNSSSSNLDFRALTYRVPLADPQFPDLHCTADGNVCVFTTGEAQVRAAASAMALLADPQLDLRTTYWLLTGIAGGAPDVVTLNSIVLARFTVQVALQYEVDARELPTGFTSGYFPQGTISPDAAWGAVYNSEVFEVSTGLRDAAANMLASTHPVDTPEARANRAYWAGVEGFEAASATPQVVLCDVATSDVFYTGAKLGDSFAERTRIWTNDTGRYCATAQEDGAVTGALLRGALEGRLDFERIAIVRTISDFDRPYPGQTVLDNLVNVMSYKSAVDNVYLAGSTIAAGIVAGWNETFAHGIPSPNYVGDVWGTLGGTPDFGPGRVDGGKPVYVPGARD